MEDIEQWIADMEGQLASEDLGKDLISVNNLIKKHQVKIMIMVDMHSTKLTQARYFLPDIIIGHIIITKINF